jgi:hypothetical protein
MNTKMLKMVAIGAMMTGAMTTGAQEADSLRPSEAPQPRGRVIY